MSDGSIQTKRGLQLDRVVLLGRTFLGRTFEEYRRYFLLEPDLLIGKRVLDVAGGVSSFCAEANNLGINVTSFDPIYSLSPEKITERSEPDLEAVTAPLAVCRRTAGVITKIPITCANYASARPRSF